jgi:mitochondrial-processing peptidase subunit alpha
LYQTCFGDQNLGRSSLYVPNEIKESDLLKYIKKYVNPSRCVIVGVNVDYDLFPKLAEKYFNNFNNSQNEIFLNSNSNWIGGEQRFKFLEPPSEVMKQNIPPLTSVNLSFQGFSLSDKDIYAAHVLETLIGGGDSFSAGGPGKGLHSVIHSRYLCRYDFYSMKCEHKAFTDNGVFQISASTRHEIAYQLIHPIAHLYQTMFDDISIEEIQSAKNRFKSMILSVLEDIHGLSTNLAYDILYLNHIRSGYYLCNEIDKVTLEDMKRVRNQILQSKPTLTVIGNIDQVETYDKVERFIQHLRK